MQRSHSMHVNLSVEDLVAVSTSTSLGVTPVNGRTNGTTIMPRSASGVTILDIMNPRSYSMEKAMKRDSRFQSENCIHMIPLVILLCYFCLWIASSEVPVSGDEHTRRAILHTIVPADIGPPGLQVHAPFEAKAFVIEQPSDALASSFKKVQK